MRAQASRLPSARLGRRVPRDQRRPAGYPRAARRLEPQLATSSRRSSKPSRRAGRRSVRDRRVARGVEREPTYDEHDTERSAKQSSAQVRMADTYAGEGTRAIARVRLRRRLEGVAELALRARRAVPRELVEVDLRSCHRSGSSGSHRPPHSTHSGMTVTCSALTGSACRTGRSRLPLDRTARPAAQPAPRC